MSEPPRDPPAAADAPAPVAHLELKAALLVLAMLLLLAGAVLYLLYARGAFERTQELVLIADDSEGVSVGMDMTFSGFPIGRVRRIELASDGSVRIVVDVPVKDAGWLRSSSVFVLSRGLVGGTSLRAYSGVLDDPPLPGGFSSIRVCSRQAAVVVVDRRRGRRHAGSPAAASHNGRRPQRTSAAPHRKDRPATRSSEG